MSHTSSENPQQGTPSVNHASNIMYLLKFLWRWSPRTVPLSFLAALSEVMSPFITIFLPKLIIDALQNSTNAASPETAAGYILQTILIATLILLAANILGQISRTTVQILSMNNRLNLMVECETKTVTMDYAHIEDPAGQTARQKAFDALNGNSSGGESVIVNLALLLAHLLGIVVYFLLIAGLHPGIMLLMVVGSLLNFWALRRAQVYEANNRDAQAAVSKKRQYIHDRASDYQNAKDIRLYNMSGWLGDLMDKFLDELMHLRKANLRRYFVADSIESGVALLRDGLAYAYLIGQVLTGQISVGDFTLVFAAIAGISNWMTLITNDIHLVMMGSRDVGYLRDYLAIPDSSNRSEGKPPVEVTMPEIIFENVSFRYPGSDTWILRNFNLTIRSGEKMALVGMNGAGKTTCVKLLTGLYHPTEGCVLINGIDSREFDRDRYFELFAAVFQETRVLAMDLARNIAVCPAAEVDHDKVTRCLDLAGLNDKLSELPRGLQTSLTRALDDEGVDLSGGQTQKLMLARALYKDAPVVIMDEPTAALDPIAEAELYQRYNEMVGQKTSLYISHRLASTRFCDRIAFITDGIVSELGSHEQLMKQGGAYAAMYEVQAHYYQDDVKEVAINV